MGKLGSHSSVRRVSGVLLGLLLAGTAAPIAARASVFTWDPAGVLPSLGQPAFTADAIQGYHYLFDLSPIANPSPTIYTVHFIEPITGFTLAGATVAVNCVVSPALTVAVAGVTLTPVTCTTGTFALVSTRY